MVCEDWLLGGKAIDLEELLKRRHDEWMEGPFWFLGMGIGTEIDHWKNRIKND